MSSRQALEYQQPSTSVRETAESARMTGGNELCESYPNRPQRPRCIQQRKPSRVSGGIGAKDPWVKGALQAAEVDMGSDFDVLCAGERGVLQLQGSRDNGDVGRGHRQRRPPQEVLVCGWGRRWWRRLNGHDWGQLRRRARAALKHLPSRC